MAKVSAFNTGRLLSLRYSMVLQCIWIQCDLISYGTAHRRWRHNIDAAIDVMMTSEHSRVVFMSSQWRYRVIYRIICFWPCWSHWHAHISARDDDGEWFSIGNSAISCSLERNNCKHLLPWKTECWMAKACLFPWSTFWQVHYCFWYVSGGWYSWSNGRCIVRIRCPIPLHYGLAVV